MDSSVSQSSQTRKGKRLIRPRDADYIAVLQSTGSRSQHARHVTAGVAPAGDVIIQSNTCEKHIESAA